MAIAHSSVKKSTRNNQSSNLRRTHEALLSSALVVASVHASAQVTFDVTFDGSANVLTTVEKNNITSHVQEAGHRWAETLVIPGPRSLQVTIFVGNIPTASGSSVTSVLVGSIGGRDTYEQGAASELRTGIDPNGTAADANLTFGLTYLRNELWFDPNPQARTATVPGDRTDAMSVVLHEFGHMLAYNGFADVNTGQPPETFWSVWDRWMIPGSPTRFSGPYVVASWGAMPDLTTGNINHWANPAQEINGILIEPCADGMIRWVGGVPVPRQCIAPASSDAPLSRDRVRDSSINVGGNLIDQLMNGVVFYRGSRYDISALDLAVLRDVGLAVDRILVDGFDPP
jgi:hypothetical protein